ncbi:MAG TPA: CDP-glycerol glycerophosphotransferase family protein [Micromonosporaceae bacterium]|nr:CDP-glycerol glycerophosphotransferase family protein [Micromonosporaceae bacterium]
MSFRAKLQSRALQTAMNAVAVLAMIALLLASWRDTGYILAAIALAIVIWVSATVSFALTMPAQLLIVVSLLADYEDSVGHAAQPTLVATGVILSALVVTQPNLQELVNQQVMSVAHLPGYQRERRLVVPPRVFYIANILLIIALGISALVRAPLWPVLAATIVACLGVGLVGAQALRLRLRGRTDSKAFRTALTAYDPKFAVYFSAPDNTEYQLTMWLPYLERIGEPFVVIVREEPAFARIASKTKAPVMYCPTVNHVDTCVTDRMRACFFVNNGAKNTHIVRFNHLTHIQLLHGDSDKASSFNPVTAMFDRIFVAGQAGIDRYAANGVHIPLDRFDIVGRPQVETINVSTAKIGDRPDERKTVLYATTWVGLYTDANYCSLPSGERIVGDLLARGVRVIFRPHPYSSRDAASSRVVARIEQMLAEDAAKSGRSHLFGPAATREMSVFDCVNAADAMIGDVSSVATDWLYSGKPFALTNPLGLAADAYETEFPLARAAYVLDKSLDDIRPTLDKLLHTDPIAATRRLVRRYYLGDFAPEHYADGFVQAARKYVVAQPASTVRPPAQIARAMDLDAAGAGDGRLDPSQPAVDVRVA